MKIREVFPGTVASPQSAFIELQMIAPGQNLVGGHRIDFYNAAGTMVHSYPFGTNHANGSNQATLLVGGSSVPGEDEFDVLLASTMQSINGGGAVCWRDGAPPDCVAWGSFTGGALLPVPGAGTPVLPAGIPDGFSITRTIAPNCPTLLEDADDTNNSAVDFQQTMPIPRGNAATPTETPCGPGGGNGSGSPNTKIKKRPKNRSTDTSPTFKFSSTEVDSTFKCKLDRKKFRKCKSPKTYHGLKSGKHTFKVEAIDADGNVDPTPAKDKFTVLP